MWLTSRTQMVSFSLPLDQAESPHHRGPWWRWEMAKWEESRTKKNAFNGLGVDSFSCQAWMRCWLRGASFLDRQVGCRYLHCSQDLRGVAARFWVGDCDVQNKGAPGVLSQGELHGPSGPLRDPKHLSSLEFKETVGLCRALSTDSNYQVLSLKNYHLCVSINCLESLGPSATGPSLLKETHLGTMEMILLGLHDLSWHREALCFGVRQK